MYIMNLLSEMVMVNNINCTVTTSLHCLVSMILSVLFVSSKQECITVNRRHLLIMMDGC